MSPPIKERSSDFDEDRVHVSGQANIPLSAPPHALSSEVFLVELEANISDGLSFDEAKTRLDKYGTNELDNGPGVQPVKILIRQMANAMILVNCSTSVSRN